MERYILYNGCILDHTIYRSRSFLYAVFSEILSVSETIQLRRNLWKIAKREVQE